MWSDEVKQIVNAYETYEGYLGVPRTYTDDHGKSFPGGTVSWYSCREDFHNQSRGVRLFYFSFSGASPSQVTAVAHRPKAICAFIDKFEDKLGLNIRTKMGPTNRGQAIWIQRPMWWTCENMRRSLYTALLRAGMNYDLNKDNFDQTLRSRDYTGATMPAVDRFLKGFTSYKGDRIGWQSAFYSMTPKSLESALVLPTRMRKHVES
jgi:hypothetical protein